MPTTTTRTTNQFHIACDGTVMWRHPPTADDLAEYATAPKTLPSAFECFWSKYFLLIVFLSVVFFDLLKCYR